MPIGTVTPGEPVTITPDSPPVSPYASLQMPSPTEGVSVSDIHALALAILNIQQALIEGVTVTPGSIWHADDIVAALGNFGETITPSRLMNIYHVLATADGIALTLSSASAQYGAIVLIDNNAMSSHAVTCVGDAPTPIQLGPGDMVMLVRVSSAWRCLQLTKASLLSPVNILVPTNQTITSIPWVAVSNVYQVADTVNYYCSLTFDAHIMAVAQNYDGASGEVAIGRSTDGGATWVPYDLTKTAYNKDVEGAVYPLRRTAASWSLSLEDSNSGYRYALIARMTSGSGGIIVSTDSYLRVVKHFRGQNF
jgi:hypothetical protein